MREILFRGKQLNGSEWFVGDLSRIVQNDGRCFVFPADGYNSPDWYEVDPLTVGQYTGLTDKNGVKIFEGDILKGLRYRDFGQGGEYVPCQYVVTWEERKPGFYPFHFFDGDSYNLKNFEVIGNIHDNPELLEGGDPT